MKSYGRGFGSATRQRRPPPEKGVKMGKKQGSLRTPTDDDGGDRKEETLFGRKPEKKPAPSLPPSPLPSVEQQWFRCKNPNLLKLDGEPYEWSVAKAAAGDVTDCPDCGASGADGFEKIEASQVGRYKEEQEKKRR